jgi:hypothetical protein
MRTLIGALLIALAVGVPHAAMSQSRTPIPTPETTPTSVKPPGTDGPPTLVPVPLLPNGNRRLAPSKETGPLLPIGAGVLALVLASGVVVVIVQRRRRTPQVRTA